MGESGRMEAPGRPLRVALVGEYPVREDLIQEGGIQSVTHQLAHALARRGDVECHVFCATRGAESAHQHRGALHIHFVPRLPLPYLATCRLHDVPRLVRRIRALRPHVVHGQGQDRHGLAAVRCGLPAVVTPHGVIRRESRWLKRHRFDLAGAIKRTLMDRNEREVFRRAGHMVIISRYLGEIYGSMLSAHAHFIENPIDPTFFELERRPQRGRLLFAGTVVPRKCVHHLVEALDRLRSGPGGNGSGSGSAAREARLVIAGPLIDASCAGQIRALAARRGLTPAVTLTGALSQAELLDEFARAEVLLLSSREETAPQVIAQAMACGLPVVASAVAGVPYMIRDGETGLLFPFEDIAACAERIRRVLEQPALAADLARQARSEARRRFHPDSVAESTLALYREIAASGP